MVSYGRKIAAGGLAALLVSAVGAVRADEPFYREERLEGTLYVFAVEANHSRFEATKEVKPFLTKPGYGPSGEDVVFDSADALTLFDGRHPSGEKHASISWKDGKTRLRSEHAALDLWNRVQFRFTEQMPDSKVQLAGTAAAGDDLGSFWVRRAKTQIRGWVFSPDIIVELQIGWAAADSGFAGTTFSGLEDAAITWDVSKKQTFEIKAGQYKVPFGRQEFTYSEFLQFVDRDILSGEFTEGRDVGVSILGFLANKKLEYRAGVFNGNGRNQPNNDNNKFEYAARVNYSPLGDVGYSEGDFESKDHPLFTVGAEFQNNNQFYASNANNFDTTIYGGEVVFKYRGFSLFGEYFDRKLVPQNGGPSFHSNGWHTQVGYFLVRNKVEVAFRYATWDPTSLVASNDMSETGGALNYFVRKHDLKLQTDFRALKDEGQGTTNHEWRIQTQFVF